MTDPNEQPAPDEPDEQPDATDDEHGNPNREAAKYRRRLRDTETERDQLRERLTARDRADVERIAAARLDRPDDLWLVHNAVNDFYDDEGNVSDDKVNKALDGLLNDRPAWAKRTSRRDPDQGRGNGRTDTGGGWADLVRGEG